MADETKSSIEIEIISLAAVWDLIDSMVHYGHFEKDHETENTSLMFKTRDASKLFLIILADFLSHPRDGTLGLEKPSIEGSMGRTYLGYLQKVSEYPQFSGDCELLAVSVERFAKWLDGNIVVEDVWLPSIERNGDLNVKRLDYIKICGTISKHGFTRLDQIVSKIQRILAENDTKIDEEEVYLTIPDFQEWFQDNIFIASSTQIAWHLNEIRWGIYHYLKVEFERSYTPTAVVSELQMYAYDVPSGIKSPLVKSMYWYLMNNVRSAPNFPRFTMSKYTQELY